MLGQRSQTLLILALTLRMAHLRQPEGLSRSEFPPTMLQP
jgi:hypothetical protein